MLEDEKSENKFRGWVVSIKISANWKVFTGDDNEAGDLIIHGLSDGGFNVELMTYEGEIFDIEDLMCLAKVMEDLNAAFQDRRLQRLCKFFKNKDMEIKGIKDE